MHVNYISIKLFLKDNDKWTNIGSSDLTAAPLRKLGRFQWLCLSFDLKLM